MLACFAVQRSGIHVQRLMSDKKDVNMTRRGSDLNEGVAGHLSAIALPRLLLALLGVVMLVLSLL